MPRVTADYYGTHICIDTRTNVGYEIKQRNDELVKVFATATEYKKNGEVKELREGMVLDLKGVWTYDALNIRRRKREVVSLSPIPERVSDHLYPSGNVEGFWIDLHRVQTNDGQDLVFDENKVLVEAEQSSSSSSLSSAGDTQVYDP